MNENNVRLIQYPTTNNSPPPTAPIPPELEWSRRSHRSGDRESQSRQSISRARNRRPRSPSVRSRRERSPISSESESFSRTLRVGSEEIRKRGLSPFRNDQAPRYREESTTQKIRDLDAKIDAINTGANALVTVDTLVRQIKPPFPEIGYSDEVMCKAFLANLKGSARTWFRKFSPGTINLFGDLCRLFVSNFISCRVRPKKCIPPVYSSPKREESLKDYVKRFNQAVLEVEGASDKVVVMAMMEGLRPVRYLTLFSKILQRPNQHSEQSRQIYCRKRIGRGLAKR
ncbi:DNA double-strand break repair Rad50 ATPase like [Actinidia chinensis var. chinensis]|uniref:DNA double-strand break repair Rad50 ATPase like n=1 Tax=Actinidia chinensis var. chinensis TaxID=1590841 RepID=A0A2R6R5V6_ACTCC|nr:DNA double-strand break repair Rad50 ATPase like [Actinidia chinensis var. chinensis]PSS21396.1 DNA double-strand break repair Rad50 ATPase like [Actinidia chinensis var. chinensis]